MLYKTSANIWVIHFHQFLINSYQFSGIVRGTYSYVDANGILQTVNYVSDAEGFKVAATNLPQAPVAAPYTPVAAPITPVVAPAAGEIDLRNDGDILDIRK